MSLGAAQKRGRPAGGSAGLATAGTTQALAPSLPVALDRFNRAFDQLEAVLRRLDQRVAAAGRREP